MAPRPYHALWKDPPAATPAGLVWGASCALQLLAYRFGAIASLSFGARRRFQLRHLKDQEQKEILLKEGSLLVMEGELQQHWKHQLPKALKVKEARINLTFRPVQIKK